MKHRTARLLLAASAAALLHHAPLAAQSATDPPPFLRTGPSLTQPPAACPDFVKARWMDRDGDGWDDLWVYMNRTAHRDHTTDTDGDTVSDYDEMLRWRDPNVEGPPLGWPFLTVAEIMQAQIATEALRQQNEARMAQRRAELQRFAGTELLLDEVGQQGGTLAEVTARRTAKYRQRVLRERPLKAARMQKAREELRRRGIPESSVDSEGRISTFGNEENGRPVFYITQNVMAAETISANRLNLAPGSPGGGLGLNLTGKGVVIGHFDSGNVFASHGELAGLTTDGKPRVTDMDPADPAGVLEGQRHATHTAGTMISLGNVSAARGLAPDAQIETWDNNGDLGELDDTYLTPDPSDDILFSNHSYGRKVGWDGEENGAPAWHGIVWLNNTLLSSYTEESCAFDSFVEETGVPLPVVSAGNDRFQMPVIADRFYAVNHGTMSYYVDTGDGFFVWQPLPLPEADGASANGYQTLKPQACAKNVLTVGSCLDLPGGIQGGGSFQMSAFSSRGPVIANKNHCVKPDVVANGADVYSTWIAGGGQGLYESKSGTSMAAPAITASLALLLEHYRSSYGAQVRLWASTMKALIIFGADDVGPEGPDYDTGYGVANVKRSAETISADGAHGRHPFIKQMIMDVTKPSPHLVLPLTPDFTRPVRTVLAWNDPASDAWPMDCQGDVYIVMIDAIKYTQWEWVDDDENEETPLVWMPVAKEVRSWDPVLETGLGGLSAAPAERTGAVYSNVHVIDVPPLDPATYVPGTLRLEMRLWFDSPWVNRTAWGEGKVAVSLVMGGVAAPPAPEFKITNIERVSSTPHVFSLQWPAVVGEFYRIETSTDLVNWTRAKKPGGPAGALIGDISALVEGGTTMEVLAEVVNARQFWRVKRVPMEEMIP